MYILEALGIYVFDRYYDGWPFYVKTTHDFVLFFEYKFNYNSWCIGRDVSGLNTVLCLNYGCDMKCPNYQDYPYRNQKKDCYNYGGGWKTRTWSVYRDLSFRIDCVQDLVQTTEVDIQTRTPEGGTGSGNTDYEIETIESDSFVNN